MKETITAVFNSNNEFFKLAQGAKRLPHIAFSSLLLPVLFVLIGVSFKKVIAVPLLFGITGGISDITQQVFGLFSLFGMLALAVFLWMKFYEGRPIRTVGFPKESFAKNYFSGFGLGMGMMICTVGIMWIAGAIEVDSSSPETTGINAFGMVSLLLLSFIVQGGSEELLTRGWMFQVIGARYKPWLGALLCSLFFSLLHLGNSGVNAIAVINLFLFAVLTVLLVMKDGNIWAACAWHSAWNWTMGNVLGLPVSGTDVQYYLFNFKTSGNAIIGGAGFGPEGSIIASTVLLTAIIILAVKIEKTN